MTDEKAGENQAPEAQAQEALPPYVIEGARSSRSRCKTCRRKIDKGVLRLGVLIEGPYGTGYMWHHLGCAARRRFEQVEEAYRLEAWQHAKEPPKKLPGLDQLATQREKAEEKKKQRRELPYAELDPSGRAKCKHCGEPLSKGVLRVVVGREVEFGGQTRVGPIQVHPACVVDTLDAPDTATEFEGFEEALRANSADLGSEQLDGLMAEIGPLDGPVIDA